MRFVFMILVAMGLLVSAALSSAVYADLNVRDFGARGDGKADDTAALNQAVATGALTAASVVVPEGVYLVDPAIGVKLVSGSHLLMDAKAVLQAMPSKLGSYRVIRIYDCEGVEISGGRVIGERDQHDGKDGEWGMGIDVRASRRVKISGVWVEACWGDGIYITACEDVAIVGVTCHRNRRQGVSVVDGEQVRIVDSTFSGTGGVLPGSGIQIEPNANQHVSDVTIAGCCCRDNAGRGIGCAVPNALVGSSSVKSVVVEKCVISHNGKAVPSFGVEVSNCESVSVLKCELSGNQGIGVGVIGSGQVRLERLLIRGTVRTSNRSDAGAMWSKSKGAMINCRIVENWTPGMFFDKSYVETRANTVVRNNRK